MFVVTKRLKRFAVEKLGCGGNATDADITKACARAVKEKRFTREHIYKMAKDPVEKKSLNDRIEDLVEKRLERLVGDKRKNRDADKIERKSKATAKDTVDRMKKNRKETPEDVIRKNRINVKHARESYDWTTKQATYPMQTKSGSAHSFAGQPVFYEGNSINMLSEGAVKAVDVFVRWSLTKSTVPQNLPRAIRPLDDHEKELMEWMLKDCKWTGHIGGINRIERRKLSELERKALLDDTSSGGLEATPIMFDDAVILTPILSGELFPFVNVVNVVRGRRIEGFSMQNPTFTSGTPEGTAITPFSTTNFISAFDTTINVASGAMEIGLDFEDDSPTDIGSQVITQFGLKAMEWLDRVIAYGDGVVEPLGIMRTPGVVSLNSDNGANGPITVGDVEALMRGVTKAFRKEPGAVTAFLSSDTTYFRIRGIPVGPMDERRVFGQTHEDYMLMSRPYKVQNDIPNNFLAFTNLKRYRMYRRLGSSIRIETAGSTLARANTRLIVIRMRFGGQPELGGAVAMMQDVPL